MIIKAVRSLSNQRLINSKAIVVVRYFRRVGGKGRRGNEVKLKTFDDRIFGRSGDPGRIKNGDDKDID